MPNINVQRSAIAMDLLISEIRLNNFSDAVRAKDRWVFKIGDLGKKWAEEANLIRPGIEVDQRVVDTLWELRAEADRIKAIDHRIRLHSDTLPERTIDNQKISEDVRASLKYARTSNFAIRAPELRDTVGVYVSDGLVPASLQQELVKELDALAAIEPKDFHPGTHGMVQDLIHPSLYPYVAETSPVHPGVKLPFLVDGKFVTTVSFDEDSISHSSQYAWVPSIFTVSQDRTEVSIDSYINGLGPRERFPTLYRLIEKVFLCALPHFEQTRAATFASGTSASFIRWAERSDAREGTSKEDWEQLLAKQADEKAKSLVNKKEKDEKLASRMKSDWQNRQISVDPSDPFIPTSLQGQSLKVIVKAANYILKPGETYTGTWHLEGMPHERIAASVIYYFDSNEHVRDLGLGFRRARSEDDFPGIMDYTHENFSISFYLPDTDPPEIDYDAYETDYPSDWEDDNQYVPLGTVTTTFANEAPPPVGHGTGRIISFPNWIQHKVQGLGHAASIQDAPPAVRKILCFFLVDDSDQSDTAEYPAMSYDGLAGVHVLTTADIPEQNRGTNVPTLRILLPRACEALTERTLPPELVELILEHDLGLTREMAEKHRRGFMEDRKIKVNKESDLFESEYSLCEH